MKISTLVMPFFICSMFVVSFAGCKKLSNSDSKPPGNTVTVRTNPDTAKLVTNYDFNDTTLTNHGWAKTFEDNFDGDLSKWSMPQGGVQYELETNEPANIAVTNSALQITARKETKTGPVVVDSSGTKTFNYTSGWLISRTTISASAATPRVRVVARVKTAAGYGIGSILCTFGNNWPTNGEIVCLQTYDQVPKRYSTDYSYGVKQSVDDVKDSFQFNPTNADLSAAYHVYTMEWTQNSLTFYIDGNLVETKTAGNAVPDLFNKAHYISLRVPVGGKNFDASTTPSIQNGTMYVDYVKVFTTKVL